MAKKVTRWAFLYNAIDVWFFKSRTLADARQRRANLMRNGFRCSPIVKLEIPAKKEARRAR